MASCCHQVSWTKRPSHGHPLQSRALLPFHIQLTPFAVMFLSLQLSCMWSQALPNALALCRLSPFLGQPFQVHGVWWRQKHLLLALMHHASFGELIQHMHWHPCYMSDLLHGLCFCSLLAFPSGCQQYYGWCWALQGPEVHALPVEKTRLQFEHQCWFVVVL